MRGKKPQTTNYPKFPKLDYIFELNPTTGKFEMYVNNEGLPVAKGETKEVNISTEKPLGVGFIEICFFLKNVGAKSGVYISSKEEIPLFGERSKLIDKGTPDELRERHNLTTHAMILFVNKAGNKCAFKLTGTQRSAFMDWKTDTVKDSETLEFFEDAPDFKIIGWDTYNFEITENKKVIKRNSKVPKFEYVGNLDYPANAIKDFISVWCNYRGEEMPELESVENGKAEPAKEETAKEEPAKIETAAGNFEAADETTETANESPADDLPF